MSPLSFIILGIAVFGAAASFFLGKRWAIALVLLGLVVTGAVAHGISENAFQLFLMLIAFGALFVVAAAVMGIAAGLSLRKGRYVAALCLLLPFPILLGYDYATTEGERKEQKLADRFVRNHRQLQTLVGPARMYPSSMTKYSLSSDGRYEYSFDTKPPMYAIVNVSRHLLSAPEFRLACVTTLSLGNREANAGACDQSTVPLPK